MVISDVNLLSVKSFQESSSINNYYSLLFKYHLIKFIIIYFSFTVLKTRIKYKGIKIRHITICLNIYACRLDIT